MKNSMVKIPKSLYMISQSNVIYFLLYISFRLSPIAVVVFLLLCRGTISSRIGGETLKIIFLLCALLAILTGLLFRWSQPSVAERFVRRIQNRPLKKWISKNVNCPYCGGKLKAKRSSKSDEFFFHYEYFCGKCGRKFKLKSTERKLEWKMVSIT